MNDNINHPKHYTSDPSGIECIEITRHRNFNIGNAIKYLWRAGLKQGNSDIQDLQKAIWYTQQTTKSPHTPMFRNNSSKSSVIQPCLKDLA